MVWLTVRGSPLCRAAIRSAVADRLLPAAVHRPGGAGDAARARHRVFVCVPRLLFVCSDFAFPHAGVASIVRWRFVPAAELQSLVNTFEVPLPLIGVAVDTIVKVRFPV